MKRNKRGTGSVAVVHLSVFLVALSACNADSRAEEPQAAFNTAQETGAEDGLPKDQQALSSARLVHIANDTAAHSGVHGQIPGAKKEGQVVKNSSVNHNEVDTSKLTHISGAHPRIFLSQTSSQRQVRPFYQRQYCAFLLTAFHSWRLFSRA